jgi:hypothetical protein
MPRSACRHRNAPRRWIRRRITVAQHLGTGQMCDQADIGDGGSIAAAEAPGARVAHQHVFDRATTRIVPMREPLHTGRLIELKLLFEIFSQARDDKDGGPRKRADPGQHSHTFATACSVRLPPEPSSCFAAPSNRSYHRTAEKFKCCPDGDASRGLGLYDP